MAATTKSVGLTAGHPCYTDYSSKLCAKDKQWLKSFDQFWLGRATPTDLAVLGISSAKVQENLRAQWRKRNSRQRCSYKHLIPALRNELAGQMEVAS